MTTDLAVDLAAEDAMIGPPPGVRPRVHIYWFSSAHTVPFSPAERGPPREDLPLPTEPPFTAFVGNLAFDLNETDLEEFFAGLKVRFLPVFNGAHDLAPYAHTRVTRPSPSRSSRIATTDQKDSDTSSSRSWTV